jgi:hypothetical protein
VAIASIGAVTAVIAGCTNPGGGIPWRTTTSRATTPTTDCHGHTDDDHANRTTTTMDHSGGGMDHHGNPGVTFPPCNGQTTTTMGGHDGGHGHGQPGHINHPPTAAQKAWAYKLVRDTAAQLRGMTTTRARLMGYQNIGDGVHYTNNAFRNDGREYDPNAIESLVFTGGQISAAMYNLEPTTTLANVRDYAGNWLVYHTHDNLCWPRNRPNDWTITPCGIGERRTPVLMTHVWIRDTSYATRCGVFATITGLGEGSCIPELRPSVILAGRNPL